MHGMVLTHSPQVPLCEEGLPYDQPLLALHDDDLRDEEREEDVDDENGVADKVEASQQDLGEDGEATLI